jgi:hypothetical protein
VLLDGEGTRVELHTENLNIGEEARPQATKRKREQLSDDLEEIVSAECRRGKGRDVRQ